MYVHKFVRGCFCDVYDVHLCRLDMMLASEKKSVHDQVVVSKIGRSRRVSITSIELDGDLKNMTSD